MNKNIKLNRIDRFSPSGIIDYISCPKMFYYKYVAKVQLPQKQIHLVFGSAIHAGLEGLFTKKDPYKEFEKYFLKEKLMDDEQNLFQEYLVLGKDMLRNYLERHETLNKLYGLNEGESEKYERDFIVNPLSGEKSSLPMSSKTDRITDSERIIEFKTSKRKWKKNALNFTIQTKLYSLRHFANTGRLPEEIVYIILLKEFNKYDKSQKIQVLTTNYTKQDLAQTFEQVELILSKINNNEFNRSYGFHSPYCDCFRYEEVLNFK